MTLAEHHAIGRSGRQNPMLRRLQPAITGACLLILASNAPASAEQVHRVKPTETLVRIAKKYKVPVSALKTVNGMRDADSLRVGQEILIPEHGLIIVTPGQTLTEIAKHYGVSVSKLAKANPTNARLKVGQQLRLPGSRRSAGAKKNWGRPRHRNRITVVRARDKKKRTFRAISKQGRVTKQAVRLLAQLMRPPGRWRKRTKPNRRLIALLARVSNHFGGRKITLVSGFRTAGGYTRETSRHVRGRAIDFRIQGVNNSEIRDYLRKLPRAGVGYYPRSTFVHLDVRKRRTYWVDWSRPGKRPLYRKPSQGPPERDVATEVGIPVIQRSGARHSPGGEDVPAGLP